MLPGDDPHADGVDDPQPGSVDEDHREEMMIKKRATVKGRVETQKKKK